VGPTTTRTNEQTKKSSIYYWCAHHGYYMVHKPEECTLKDRATEKGKGASAPPAQVHAAVIHEVICLALEAVLEADE
jgi:hypothetical protein